MQAWLSNLLFTLIVFITNIIQGITGFAGTVLAMPFSILLVGKDFAKPILNVVGFFICLVIAIINYKKVDWKYVGFIILFMGIGMVIGFFIERFWYSDLFLKIYGGIICLIAIIFFFIKRDIKFPLWVNIIVMILAGMIHMIFVSGGPLLILAVKAKLPDKDKFRATLAVVWSILNIFILGADTYGGNISLESVKMIFVLIPMVMLSLYLGKVILGKLNNNVFFKITCVLLFISGVTIII